MNRKRAALWKIGAVGLSGLLASLVGGQAAADITGSAHDLRSIIPAAGGQICVVCHTPHFGTTGLDAPLWNHEETVQTFQTYASGTLDATGLTGNPVPQPDGSSRLCLSCHDGSVAVDSFGGRTGSIIIQDRFNIGDGVSGAGDDLRNDHPISFVYDTALATADGGLWDPATTTVTIGGSGGKTKTGLLQDVMLISDKVQCASCHDVHNNFTDDFALLKVNNGGSGLCLTCHNK
jgi:predicted CXXCH cytochrome family protein